MRFKHFTYPLITSVLLHAAGLASASRLMELGGQGLPSELVPVELVPIAPVPTPPPPPPQKDVASPKEPETIAPPRIIDKTEAALSAPVPTLPAVEEHATPSPVHISMEYPREAKELLSGPLPSPETAVSVKPEPGPLLPLPAINADGRGNVLGPTALAPREPVAPVQGGEAGAGRLYVKGDAAVVPGTGSAGGSGGPGSSGLGLGRTGAGEKVAGITPGAGGEGPGGGAGRPIRLARPHGGYQIRPRYPESARKSGIEGITLLKFEILADGTVGKALIERSAGHRDLDLTAIEAVKQWRFDPARRGNQPIAVWVTLPVRFELR